MMMSFRTIFIQISLVFSFACLRSSYSQEWLEGYPALGNLPADCKPQSCSDVKEDGRRQNQICDCDDGCSTYGTCCIGTPFATGQPRKSSGIQTQCSEVYGSSFAVYTVSSCSPRWESNPNIRERCETAGPNNRDPLSMSRVTNNRDPLSMFPVTNPTSGRTYKNFFCSLCNFDHLGSVLWKVLLKFRHPKLNTLTVPERENILSRLEFDESTNSWGVRNVNGGGDRDFIPALISAEIPPTLQSFVRRCNTMVNRLESQCATTWNDTRTRQMCDSYLSPIKVRMGDRETKRFVDFRNPHCAVCNYAINFKETFCPAPVSIDFEAGKVSFTLLLDFNPSDGNNVGETNSCAKNEVYDPFFKECRALVCAVPGYVLKNERCGPA